MKIHIEIDENELRELVLNAIQERVTCADVKEKDVQILVKTKQNYKAEWEAGSFRAVYSVNTK